MVVPVPSWLTEALPVIFGVKVMASVWLKFTVAVPAPPATSEAARVPAVPLPPNAPIFNVPTEPLKNPRVTLPVPLPPTLTVPLPVTLSVPVPTRPTLRSLAMVQLPLVTVTTPAENWSAIEVCCPLLVTLPPLTNKEPLPFSPMRIFPVVKLPLVTVTLPEDPDR